MPHTHGHPGDIEQLADVVGMHAVDHHGGQTDSGLPSGRAHEPHAGQLPDPGGQALTQLGLARLEP
jgi:hypothetical protein